MASNHWQRSRDSDALRLNEYHIIPAGYDGEIGVDHGWTTHPLSDDQCRWSHDFEGEPTVALVLSVIERHQKEAHPDA